MTKMCKKCSTDQRLIRKRNTTYKIHTLEFLTILKTMYSCKEWKTLTTYGKILPSSIIIFFELLTLHWQLIIDSYLSLKIASFVFDYFMIQRTRIKKRPQTRCKQTCKFFALLESRNYWKCWFKSEIFSGWTTDLFSYMYFDECRTVLIFKFCFCF